VVFWSGTTNADYRPAAKWKALGDAIEEVVMWDSVYYMRIAECGYEYEQTHAFFPALPLLMHFVANTGECQSK
jgi:phosphatidylinositol glycan class V